MRRRQLRMDSELFEMTRPLRFSIPCRENEKGNGEEALSLLEKIYQQLSGHVQRVIHRDVANDAITTKAYRLQRLI